MKEDNEGRCPRVVTIRPKTTESLSDHADIDLNTYEPKPAVLRRCVTDEGHDGPCLIEMPDGRQMLASPPPPPAE